MGDSTNTNGIFTKSTDGIATNHLFEEQTLQNVLDEKPPPYTENDGEDMNEHTTKSITIDKFDVKNVDFSDAGPSWSELNTCQKFGKVMTIIGGIFVAIGLLYIFICSLDILTSAFQLLAGRVASETFSNSVILNNPIAGLMLGVLVTVLLQSSSTSTSIVVTLVGSGILTVEQGVYIVMGANIGTSVTNTIVSLTQSVDEDVFRRSFAGATVHDMFNWLTVLILLPLEVVSGYLVALTGAIVKHIEPTESNTDEPQFLKVITDPLTKKIVKVDKSVLTAEAEDTDKQKYPLCMYHCEQVYDDYFHSFPSDMTYQERQRDAKLKEELREKRSTSRINGDGGIWIIRRGRIIDKNHN